MIYIKQMDENVKQIAKIGKLIMCIEFDINFTLLVDFFKKFENLWNKNNLS